MGLKGGARDIVADWLLRLASVGSVFANERVRKGVGFGGAGKCDQKGREAAESNGRSELCLTENVNRSIGTIVAALTPIRSL